MAKKRADAGNIFEIDYLLDFTPIVAPKMITAGMEVLEPIVKRHLGHVIGNEKILAQKSRSTGSLFRSMKVSNAFIRDNGTRFQANIYFEGHDRRGIRQGEKAKYMEYGTSRNKRGETMATRFASSAIQAARARVTAAMVQVLEDELKIEWE
jgi:hypothetical protein